MALFLVTVVTSYNALPTLPGNSRQGRKIFLMIFVAVLVINTRERLMALVWVIALSIGFYGVKGGIFTLMTGGAYHVQGPERSFIAGNNEIGLALCMTVPLLYYLSQMAEKIWVRNGLLGAAILSVLAALGTQSRGALLGLSVMGIFIWLKSRRKFQVAILSVRGARSVPGASVPVDRMSSIQNYEEDASAVGHLRRGGWRSTSRPTGCSAVASVFTPDIQNHSGGATTHTASPRSAGERLIGLIF
jgi:probable O-glycosylation ligase (exosortase A-associated)